MITLLIVLRIIHIFSGVVWLGFAVVNFFFLQPAVKATGAEGRKVMQHLTQKTRFLATIYTAATLTVLSGLGMYGILRVHNKILDLAGLAGIIAWLLVIVVIRGTFKKMRAIGVQAAGQGGEPTPELASQMQALAARHGKVGRFILALLALALLGMSVAQYVAF